MNTIPTLYRQITNGTRIYLLNNMFYTIDGEVDCRLENAAYEILTKSYAKHKTLEAALAAAKKRSGR